MLLNILAEKLSKCRDKKQKEKVNAEINYK